MQLLTIALLGVGFGVLAFQRFRLAFLVYLVVYATYPRFLAAGVSGEGFALTGQFVTGVLLSAAWGAKWALGEPAVRQGFERLRSARPVWVAVAGLYAYKVVVTFVQSPLSIGNVSGLLMEFLLGLSVVLAASAAVRTRRDVVGALSAVVLALLINEGWAVLETLKGAPLLDVEVQYKVVQKSLHEGDYRPTGYRAMGTFVNPLLLSVFASVVAPLAFFLARHGRGAAVRLGLAPLALLLAVPAVYWTRSRSGLVALLVVVGLASLLALFGRVRMSRSLRLAVIAVAAGVAVTSAFAVYGFVNELATAQTGGLATDKSALGRLVQYITTYGLLSESPRRLLFGFGVQRNLLSLLSDLISLDNYFLRTALEGGLVGLGLFGLVHLRFGQALARLARGDAFERGFAYAVRLSWAATAVSMVFVSIPYNYLYFYLLVALAALLPGVSGGGGGEPVVAFGPPAAWAEPHAQSPPPA